MSHKELSITIDLAAKLHEDVKIAAYYLYLSDKEPKKDSEFYYYLGLYNIKYGHSSGMIFYKDTSGKNRLPEKKMVRGYSNGLSMNDDKL